VRGHAGRAGPAESGLVGPWFGWGERDWLVQERGDGMRRVVRARVYDDVTAKGAKEPSFLRDGGWVETIPRFLKPILESEKLKPFHYSAVASAYAIIARLSERQLVMFLAPWLKICSERQSLSPPRLEYLPKAISQRFPTAPKFSGKIPKFSEKFPNIRTFPKISEN
jgi:hypothetical protein